MSHVIKIKSNASISTINETWLPLGGGKIIFEISKSSSFELFAEGVALGFLKEIESRGNNVEILFDPAASRILEDDLIDLKSYKKPTYKDLVDIGIPEVLCGIFGMQLLFQASYMGGVLKSSRNIGDEIDGRLKIGSCIWLVIQRNSGLLGDGKRQYLFSRHDYMVPKSLRENDHLTFPRPLTFRKKITPIIKKIGAEKLDQKDKEDLVESWLFHIAENAHEHGAVDVFDGNKSIVGYRGILIEKLVFANIDTIKKRKDISEAVRDYLLVLWNNHGLSSKSTMTVATVMDAGVGVQNSIPDSSGCGGESIDKLNKAFLRGVTRRESKTEKSGYGLFDAARIARKLKACFVLSTADLFVVNTFEYINEDGVLPLDGRCDKLKKNVGTSFSLMWPSLLNGSKDDECHE